MKMIPWGQGWEVSQICFGALPIGPLQKNISLEEGGELILKALQSGINFIDTAQSYKTYDYIAYALKQWKDKVYIATKSHAHDYQGMEEAIHEACEALGLEEIHLFHLHAARAEKDIFQKREGALKCLLDYKKKGIVHRIGISTHSAPIVQLAAGDERIDVIYPIINKAGLGILDGTREDMEKAIERAHEKGKRLYAMKIYGGGNLLKEREEALDYALSLKGIDVVSIGMVNQDELKVNLGLLDGEVDPYLMEKTLKEGKKMVILWFCKKCGICIEHCPNDALRLEEEKCHIDEEKCILCGYCAPHCPQFAIRMI